MLTLLHDEKQYPLPIDSYSIRQAAGKIDTLEFTISIHEDVYRHLYEEETVVDRGEQRYLIKKIDAGGRDAKVICELDLDEWKRSMYVGYTNDSATVGATIDAVKPSGWTVDDKSGNTIKRTIPGASSGQESFTPLEIVERCQAKYGVYFRFDTYHKVITIVDPTRYKAIGAFVTEELNLRELNYKSSSDDFCTRLYAYGKDGISFAPINGGKPYVDNFGYSSRIICKVWTDDRYTVMSELYRDTVKKLKELAVPARSYDCDVIDMRAIYPDQYTEQDFSLLNIVTLMDVTRKTSYEYQIVEKTEYPYYPEKNSIVLNSRMTTLGDLITENDLDGPDIDDNDKLTIERGPDGNDYVLDVDKDGNVFKTKIPSRIAVTTMPDKVTYMVDEIYDYTGLVIHAFYGDGTSKEVTGSCVFAPAAGEKVEDDADMLVSVTYKELKTFYSGFVLIKNRVLTISYEYMGDILDTQRHIMPWNADYSYENPYFEARDDNGHCVYYPLKAITDGNIGTDDKDVTVDYEIALDHEYSEDTLGIYAVDTMSGSEEVKIE